MIDDIKIGIIGTGALGAALAKRFHREGMLSWVVSRSKSSLKNIKELEDLKIYRKIEDIEELADVIFITVNDSALQDISFELSHIFGIDISGKYVVHCSGFIGVETLEYCEDMGANIVSAHPYQTFYSDEPSIFENVAWGIQAKNKNADLIIEIIKRIDGNPKLLSQKTIDNKSLYHVSAVAASNYLTTSMQLAKHIAQKSDIDAKEYIEPIAKTTLENNIRHLDDPDAFPLTGPIIRADANAVEKHIAELKDTPTLLKSYCHLGLATCEMALHHGSISGEEFMVLSEIFKAALK